ncbi:hypothetical protein UP06_32685 [Bradyrhizobium sp. LTSP857]|nr:hypothetical protein UP06_32685 [Bradyrhizobium sp. LTSP857]
MAWTVQRRDLTEMGTGSDYLVLVQACWHSMNDRKRPLARNWEDSRKLQWGAFKLRSISTPSGLLGVSCSYLLLPSKIVIRADAIKTRDLARAPAPVTEAATSERRALSRRRHRRRLPRRLSRQRRLLPRSAARAALLTQRQHPQRLRGLVTM